jgi:nucleoside-specific outer membrane channel protein Tsx
MNKKTFPGLLAVVALAVTLPAALRAGDDFGGWHSASLKWLDTSYVDLVTVGQARFRDNHGEANAHLLSQKAVFKAHENLNLGLAYTWLPFKTGAGDWQDQHRIEIEANPHWTFAEVWTVSLRNRFETRWIEDRPETNERIRHRIRLRRALDGLGPLRGVYAGNEFFYDLDDHDYNQNRLIPLGLSFKLHEKVGFNLYYMIQSVKSGANTSDWDHLHVLGTHMSLSF